MGILIAVIVFYSICTIIVFIKYNKDPKPTQEIDYYREELEIGSAEAAYLINKNVDGINLMLADLLELVKKGQLKLDEENGNYIFSKVEDMDFTKFKNHEYLSYELLFDSYKDQKKVNINDFLEDLKQDSRLQRDLDIKICAIMFSIRMEQENQGIIDINAKRVLSDLNKFSIYILLISLVAIMFLSMLGNDFCKALVLSTSIFAIVLNRITNKEEEKLTQKGSDLRQQAIAYKRFLLDNAEIKDKPIYYVGLLDYHYCMGVALNKAYTAEQEFISKPYQKIKRNKMIKTVGSSVKATIIFIIKKILLLVALLMLTSDLIRIVIIITTGWKYIT